MEASSFIKQASPAKLKRLGLAFLSIRFGIVNLIAYLLLMSLKAKYWQPKITENWQELQLQQLLWLLLFPHSIWP
jgi:hypothetical protein